MAHDPQGFNRAPSDATLGPVLASYHNHSRFSDGQATLEELIAAAQRLGIAELGVSDHWVLHPSGLQPRWAMPVDQLDRYVDHVLRSAQKTIRSGSTTIRLGLEVDWFPGRAEAIRSMLDPHPFDYLIGSVHEVDGFKIDSSPAAWQALTQDACNDVHRRYWQHMKSLGESRLFDIAAHIDLPKKFAFYPSIDLGDEIDAALDAIAHANMVVELNTAGWHKPCGDAYPTLDILKRCKARRIRATLNADAHQAAHLLRDFDRGARRLAEAGYDEVARFAKRQVRMEALSAAIPAGRSAATRP